MKKIKKINAMNLLSMSFLSAVTLVFIFPFYWVITGSFKTRLDSIMLPPQWFPTNPTLESWAALFRQPAWQWLLNSVFISLMTMLLVCLVSASAGYVLAKKRFKGSALLFSIFVFAMALPKQVVMIPLVKQISFMGFHNTPWAVILPAVGWPFGIFLMKQFSEIVPSELLEAAKIDGCGEVRTFWSIVVPIVKPGIAALAIFTFISSWNDYFLQLIMLNTRSNLTLQLGLALLQGEFATDYGVLMAGAALAAIPIIVMFLAFQKSFTQGITIGAVKG
ncbi:MAG: carbohydrate ABC transporter permease [Erysipelotrichaceae bacterium]